MIWEEFSQRVDEHASRVAVVDGGRELTFSGLRHAALARARQLPAPAVHPAPRRVLIRESKPAAALVAVLACWSRGHVPVMLRDRTPDGLVETVRRWTRPVAELSDGGESEILTDPHAPEPAANTFSARDEALVICTSGTSGNPKLVALPAESVCLNAATIAASLGLQPDDRVAVPTPLGYLYGLMGGCLAALWSGASCHLFEPGGPLTTLQTAIRAHGLTVVQGPPTFFRLFLGYADGTTFPGVRVVTTGGEALSDGLIDELGRTFPAAKKLALYGMTEAGPRISHEDFLNGGGRDGCIGEPYAHFAWTLEPGEWSDETGAGRLAIRGPSMFLGYIGRDGTRQHPHNDGFFRTNDLLARSADGRLHFRGRIDRIFKSGGRLVNPGAVEDVLRRHPGVREAVCLAVPHPLLGLALEAEILPVRGASLDAGALAAFARQECEPHAVPRQFRLVSDLRATAAGKLLRSSSDTRPGKPSKLPLHP
jgi:acyl-coenzyme A synthetase/AMP-(fatty) acid ligase